MIVSQFTLMEMLEKAGASFRAAAPDVALSLYQHFVDLCRQRVKVETGQFRLNVG